MKELIIQKQTINHEEVNTINARKLHIELMVQSKFADWIKNRLQDFIENIDYIHISKNLETSTGGTQVKEYYITIETAKHICMIERNEKGRQIRQYFIECENKLKTQNPFAIASRKDLLKLALEQEEKIEKLAIENQKQESVIKEYFAIDDNKTYTDVAKILHLPPLKFTLALKKLHYIRDNRMPYQKYIDCGYFIIKKTIKKYQNGLTKHFESYLITPKGFNYFSKKFNTISLT